jgi:predicted porin
MKKSLIALAVAGAISSPAFAATSNVDVYGQLTASVDFIMTDALPPADDDLLRVSSNSSRIGFKGSEDLGGGLKAIWQIENQFNIDGGTPAVAGTGGALGADSFSTGLRNTFIGLSSSEWGTALLGKHDTPYKLATGKLDIFGDSLGDYNNIVGNVNGTNTFDLRSGNVIAYITPTFSGLHGAIAYVAGAEVSNGAVGDFNAYSLMGMYENGPFFASLAYEAHNNYNGAAAVPAGFAFSTTTGLAVATPAVAAVSGADRDSWKLGLGYSLGDAKVGFIYESADDEAGLTATDRDTWYINGAYRLGNITLKAAYGNAGDGDTVADTSAYTWVLGADYDFSKRTKVYAQYQATENDLGATYGLGAGQGSAITPPAGTDPAAFSVGVRHVF